MIVDNEKLITKLLLLHFLFQNPNNVPQSIYVCFHFIFTVYSLDYNDNKNRDP